MYTLGQAARATGKSKASIHKAVKTGRISAGRTPDGHYQIDPSELHRVYPKVFTSETGETVARPEVVPGGFTRLPPTSSTHQAERPPEREVDLLREMLERERSLNRELAADRDHWREQAQRLLGPPASPAPSIRPWWRRWTGR